MFREILLFVLFVTFVVLRFFGSRAALRGCMRSLLAV